MDSSYLEIGHTDKLNGTIHIQGSKNAVLPMMAASLLQEGTVVLEGCPRISDVYDTIKLLECLGCRCLWQENALLIDTGNADFYILDDIAGNIRSSVLFLGSLFGRRGKASLPLPGGCKIGARPYDLHRYALRALGVNMWESMGRIEGIRDSNHGAEIIFPAISVGATENAILLSVVSKGTTIIRNAAKEPEIAELAEMLNGMGANVAGAGTETVMIEGVPSLTGGIFKVPGDRIVAGTYAIAAAAVGGKVQLKNTNPFQLKSLFDLLGAMGVAIDVIYDERIEPYIVVKREWSWSRQYHMSVMTMPYPGFSTDLQSQMTVLLASCPGTHCVEESIFDNRFQIVPQLEKMNGKITVSNTNRRRIYITGTALCGAHVWGNELRGTAALGLAGLIAEESTRVYGLCYLNRGYENFAEDLRSVGGNITCRFCTDEET